MTGEFGTLVGISAVSQQANLHSIPSFFRAESRESQQANLQLTSIDWSCWLPWRANPR